MSATKTDVRNFWEAAACGEALYLTDTSTSGFAEQAKSRYTIEPYIPRFAEFERWKGKKVLEIGLGLGADHQRFAEAGAELYGVDLTERSVRLVAERLKAFGLDGRSNLQVGDAENLPFNNDSFDLVYSWGVIHHSPDTARAAKEIWRVLKPGGEFRVMVYNKFSLVGLMLWVRYALFRLRPMSLAAIYSRYLESPGTKAYTAAEAKALFPLAASVETAVELSGGDLLLPGAGQRHRGLLLKIARAIWPRRLIRAFGQRLGLFLLLRGVKQR